MLRGLKIDSLAGPGRRHTVLVVDDERLSRMVIAHSLEKHFDVVEAGNGTEAIERVAAGGIDLAVVDIHMPGMDGFEVTQQIKWMNPGMFLPVVLMTASNDEDLFARGLTDGADDFLAKPITPSLLEAKIKALLRVVEILHEQRERNEELNRWRARAEQDFGVAQKLFEHIAERGRFDFPNLEIRALALEAFNGDIVLAAPLGKGRLRLLVGDFAGHGLGAALGAMPVSDVFYAMTRRRFPIEAVVREIGGKLYRMFPRHQFLAASVTDIDTVAEKALVWNGGLPTSLALDASGRIVGRAPSRHLALGVQSARDLVPLVTELPFPPGGRLVMYTDGLIEARSPSGEAFGDERLERLLSDPTGDSWFESLWSAFQVFQDDNPQGDDITLVGLRHTEALRAALVTRSPAGGLGAESLISIRLGFDHTALREPDPLAPLRILIEASPALVGCAAELYTIACELFANAVDHGVLRLDSTMKAQPGGFEEYYRRRETGLRELTSGSITVVFEVLPTPGRRVATIRISDDGPGVSEDVLRAVRDPKARSGRGLPLVTELGAELRILDDGHTVEAVFPLTDS